MSAFAELWRKHEELTARFAKLLHDDAGQVLTAIALRLSALELEGEARREARELMAQLDDLLERFRAAQSSLGAAAVAKRGLAAGLSQLARSDGQLQLSGDRYPPWPPAAALAAFRVIECGGPRRVAVRADRLVAAPAFPLTALIEEFAREGGLQLRAEAEGITISIHDAD